MSTVWLCGTNIIEIKLDKMMVGFYQPSQLTTAKAGSDRRKFTKIFLSPETNDETMSFVSITDEALWQRGETVFLVYLVGWFRSELS